MKLFSTIQTPIKTLAQVQPLVLLSFTSKTNFLNPLNVVRISSTWNTKFHHVKLCPVVSATAQETHTQKLIPSIGSSNGGAEYWLVVMGGPPEGVKSKAEVIDYYVKTLEKVLRSEKEAQMCIYDVSWENHFGFCCHIDEETSTKLAKLPEVLSVKPDIGVVSTGKDYSVTSIYCGPLLNSYSETSRLFPEATSKYWIVQVEISFVQTIMKAQAVDHFVQLLTQVLGNEKNAQMCIYHMSWESNFGFCCELDEECAQELAGVPGVLSVQPDEKVISGVYGANEETDVDESPPIKTKRLFVTGLSFYTSEKTLRAAFESFGELVEVKIIMDRISKRSKGYAFLEYTTEEAAGTALKEMNGKIINGWMIVVDVAKTHPTKFRDSSKKPAA